MLSRQLMRWVRSSAPDDPINRHAPRAMPQLTVLALAERLSAAVACESARYSVLVSVPPGEAPSAEAQVIAAIAPQITASKVAVRVARSIDRA